MKKYVYSKGAELVTVETDGLGTINNFMVTGVIGENYGGLVHSGLAFKMGDEVNIAEMLNAAKRCECKVECYEGNKLIVNESVDFTSGEPAFVGEVSGLSSGGCLRRSNIQRCCSGFVSRNVRLRGCF